MRSDLNAYRFLLLLAQGQNRTILPRPQIATSTHAHGESDEKEKRQAGVNKYRAQKIAPSTHACGDGGFVSDAIIPTDIQSTLLAQTFIRTYVHDDKTVYQILFI
ncbi:hypothetical protein AVEN_129096-1 [Araneus ventricosus]|uniref:Uncharacterized protein n=1 Tax=Araneus ventricosus TaxID=182803 RepID=A0A4Y2W6J6_ARAVE|nr:hypothetical protein AVEN_129096-1 [Araneus ventricosus]